jgi:hypothetical protein
MGYSIEFYGEPVSLRRSIRPSATSSTALPRHAAWTAIAGPTSSRAAGLKGKGTNPTFAMPTDCRRASRACGCHWVPNEDGSGLEWDGTEKFYAAEEWMAYLINHFLKPAAEASKSDDPQFSQFTFDHVLGGEIEAQGEQPDDKWLLKVKDNEVTVLQGHVVYVDPSAGLPAPCGGAEIAESFVSLRYMAADIQSYAEEAGVSESVALERAREWGRRVEEAAAKLCDELLTSVVENGQP